MALGLSQVDLARAMGISFQQIQKYEKGSNRIGPDRMLAAAAALRVSVQFFFEGIGADDLLEGLPLDDDSAGSADGSAWLQAHSIANSLSMIDDPQLRQQIAAFVAAIAASRKLGGSED